MKKQDAFNVVVILFIIAISVIMLKAVEKVDDKQNLIKEELLESVVNLDKKVLTLQSKVDSLENELDVVCVQSTKQFIELDDKIERINKEVKINSMESEMWGEDIWRLHKWHWENEPIINEMRIFLSYE